MKYRARPASITSSRRVPGQIVGQHRQAQRRQPHRLDDPRRVVAFEAEVGEDGQRLLVLLDRA